MLWSKQENGPRGWPFNTPLSLLTQKYVQDSLGLSGAQVEKDHTWVTLGSPFSVPGLQFPGLQSEEHELHNLQSCQMFWLINFLKKNIDPEKNSA